MLPITVTADRSYLLVTDYLLNSGESVKKQKSDPSWLLTCPIPIRRYPRVLLAHGGGGRLMNELIDGIFVNTFDNPHLSKRHDGAVLNFGDGQSRLAFTTDSYVIKPLFFPGGDIGSLAVNGTVNDLAMCGARPRYLSVGCILEEGLQIESLWKIVQSMKRAADDVGVQIVTGDTKVVDKGKGDGIFINTSGIGVVQSGHHIGPSHIKAGDAILLSGDIGRHGMAIMANREGIALETTLESDCASVVAPVLALLDSGIEVHCLRDLTRGGLASALCELSQESGLNMEIDSALVPVHPLVDGMCELLGLDPVYVANEGRFIAFVDSTYCKQALEVLGKFSVTTGALQIGEVLKQREGVVTIRSPIGVSRILDMFSGEQLPRIC